MLLFGENTSVSEVRIGKPSKDLSNKLNALLFFPLTISFEHIIGSEDVTEDSSKFCLTTVCFTLIRESSSVLLCDSEASNSTIKLLRLAHEYLIKQHQYLFYQ